MFEPQDYLTREVFDGADQIAVGEAGEYPFAIAVMEDQFSEDLLVPKGIYEVLAIQDVDGDVYVGVISRTDEVFPMKYVGTFPSEKVVIDFYCTYQNTRPSYYDDIVVQTAHGCVSAKTDSELTADIDIYYGYNADDEITGVAMIWHAA